MTSAPSTPTATPTPTATKASTIEAAATTHPLLLAAVLVWMSIEVIGDGLLAARSLLASLTSERNVTPS
jgi:hypothetical protein